MQRRTRIGKRCVQSHRTPFPVAIRRLRLLAGQGDVDGLGEVLGNAAFHETETSKDHQRMADAKHFAAVFGIASADIPNCRTPPLRIALILATGLHAFLTQFLDRVNELGVRISRDFLIPA